MINHFTCMSPTDKRPRHKPTSYLINFTCKVAQKCYIWMRTVCVHEALVSLCSWRLIREFPVRNSLRATAIFSYKRIDFETRIHEITKLNYDEEINMFQWRKRENTMRITREIISRFHHRIFAFSASLFIDFAFSLSYFVFSRLSHRVFSS